MTAWADKVEARMKAMEEQLRGLVEPARTGIGSRDERAVVRQATRASRVTVQVPLNIPTEAIPVGGLFLSVVATNPATLLGYGTWSAIAAGRVLVGLNSGDTDFDTVRETGGAKTVASAGTVSQPTFTGSALSTHTHAVGSYAAANESSHTHDPGTYVASLESSHTHDPGSFATNNESSHTHSVTSNVTVSDHSSHSHTFTSSANGATPDLLAPDLTGTGVAASGTTSTELLSAHSVTNNAVTSGAGSSHSHSVVGESASGSAHSHTIAGESAAGTVHTHALSGTSAATSGGTPAGTVSQPTYTGSATSVVQPYYVVYMWERTA